jgi:uracil-DNA glycosylase
MAQLRACRPFLLQVIEKLKPKNVIGMGAIAMRALRNQGETNLTKNRGKEIRISGL